jgi:predicted aconitase/predicted aconitase with swiveling domain
MTQPNSSNGGVPAATSSNSNVDTDVASGCIATHKLVSGDNNKCYGEEAKATIHPFLCSDVGLSFWGGIDELTGIVIDASHPLCGMDVSDTILALPSGRGSCTASQVLLELILNQKSPRALVLRDRDGLLCVGALVARCVLPDNNSNNDDNDDEQLETVPVLDILQVQDDTGGTKAFDALIEYQPKFASVLPDGRLVVGKTVEEVERKLDRLEFPSENNRIEEETENRMVPGRNGFESDFEFDLSQEERTMLDETSTKAERRAVEVLIRYARIVTTPPSKIPTYIDVTRAHIDGCTYIGPGGLRFVERLVQDGGKVKIPTTLNSVSTDLRYWERLGIKDDLTNRNSIRQADAYVALGCSSKSFTCAPYLLEKEETSIGIPQKGDQIVWGESNAVVYANTVLGARTEKYADYLDICCAIAGKVPQIGVHLDEPRKPSMVLSIHEDVLLNLKSNQDRNKDDDDDDDDDSFSLLFPVLGHLCGSLSDGEVPLLTGLEEYAERVTKDHLKAFCAAFGTTAASPLIHIAGITPEARLANSIDEWKQSATRLKSITAKNLEETFDLLDQQTTTQQVNNRDDGAATNHDKVDLVALGNPHLSLSEVDELLRLVENQAVRSNEVDTDTTSSKNKRDDVNVLACISRALYDKSPNVKKLEDFGFTFVRDTCW